MANPAPNRPNPAFAPSQPIMEWWSQQLFQGVAPMTRLQLAWMEGMSDLMLQEARFFAALSQASQRLGQCYDTHGSDPEKLKQCYEDIAREVTEHHMQRLHKVAALPVEFRKRIWEEI